MDSTATSRLLNSIHVPTLLLDEARARRNIQRMADKCRKSGTLLRAHFKTHQSAQVGDWFKQAGIIAITTSSVRMAAYFADHGWNDITVAFPVNWREIDSINALASRIKLGVLVESIETANFLRENLTAPVNVWIEVDTGYPRTGIDWQNNDTLVALAQNLQNHPLMTLRGLLSHNGASYACRGHADLRAFWADYVARLTSARAALEAHGIHGLSISPGDTPCCNVINDFTGIDEIRPGNFVYNDLMQVINGSVTEDDVAVAAACPVISKHPERAQVIIYGGGVHLSKDHYIDQLGRNTYGAIALPTENGWSKIHQKSYVISISQEHGIVQCDPETFASVNIGDLLIIIPVHSCMTADLLKSPITLTGETLDMLVLSAP